VRVVRADEVAVISAGIPVEEGELEAHWLEGPFRGEQLDVGIVTVSSGGMTPPHVHVGGQVMVVTAGCGFVETNGDRTQVTEGDVVICPPGELHTHGAAGTSSFSHLTITTGGYTFPSDPSPVVPQ
jgi:quercetin dioxygenase-like cupin family protein